MVAGPGVHYSHQQGEDVSQSQHPSRRSSCELKKTGPGSRAGDKAVLWAQGVHLGDRTRGRVRDRLQCLSEGSMEEMSCHSIGLRPIQEAGPCAGVGVQDQTGQGH